VAEMLLAVKARSPTVARVATVAVAKAPLRLAKPPEINVEIPPDVSPLCPPKYLGPSFTH